MELSPLRLPGLDDIQSASITWQEPDPLSGSRTRSAGIDLSDSDAPIGASRGLGPSVGSVTRALSSSQARDAGEAFTSALAGVQQTDLDASLPSDLYATTQLRVVASNGEVKQFGWPMGTSTPAAVTDVVKAGELLGAQVYAASLQR